jgi:hypothetical protein
MMAECLAYTTHYRRWGRRFIGAIITAALGHDCAQRLERMVTDLGVEGP